MSVVAGSRFSRPDGTTLYTRSGAFNTNATGQLVTIDGYAVVPNITFPLTCPKPRSAAAVQVSVRVGNSSTFTQIGQLTVANFANEAGLKPLGDNLFQETTASGNATVAAPDDPGFGLP